jgi:hypothetical protein
MTMTVVRVLSIVLAESALHSLAGQLQELKGDIYK